MTGDVSDTEKPGAARDTCEVSANLELVRSICEQWERGEYGTVAWAHPEIESAIADLPTAGSWRGVWAWSRPDATSSWRGRPNVSTPGVSGVAYTRPALAR